MAHVEVGVAAARRAAALSAAGDPKAERAMLVARIFAWEVCQLFERNSLRILTGTGEINAAAVAGSLAEIRFSEFAGSSRNVIKDMDRLADIVFGR
jgi:alkylation response protein AidB-like acyl-CoA dehydrogenase